MYIYIYGPTPQGPRGRGGRGGPGGQEAQGPQWAQGAQRAQRAWGAQAAAAAVAARHDDCSFSRSRRPGIPSAKKLIIGTYPVHN